MFRLRIMEEVETGHPFRAPARLVEEEGGSLLAEGTRTSMVIIKTSKQRMSCSSHADTIRPKDHFHQLSHWSHWSG